MPSITTGAAPHIIVENAATARRKRSSPTNTRQSSSGSISGSSIGSTLVYPVPDSVAWLEQLSLRIDTAVSSNIKKREPSYVLHVDHSKATLTWSHARTFDDYRSFQRRLQKALRHGHFCRAECPWLFTFVKSYFPKSYALGHLVAPKQVRHLRREALERFVQTLQTFLVNRQNHCCSVLTSAVADEVLAFVNGDEGKTHQCRHAPPTPPLEGGATTLSPCATTASQPRRSWDSDGAATSDPEGVLSPQDDRDESEAYSSSTVTEDDEMCRLCNCHLGDDAHSSTSVGSLTSPTALSSSLASVSASPTPKSPVHAQMSPVPEILALPAMLPLRVLTSPASSHSRRGSLTRPHVYTTQLACGHRFHDECIVPKLNDAMSCPVCGHAESHKH